MKRAVLALLALSGCGLADTWVAATNFNSPNNANASSVFSYGVGGSPAAFALLGNPTVNCFGTPSYCYDNGVSFPDTSAVTWNGTGSADSYYTVVQPTTDVRMDPQDSTGVIVQFTAPRTDTYSISGLFEAIDADHQTTTGDVFVNGVLADTGTIGVYGSSHTFSLSGQSLLAGQTIDFIVITASGSSFLSTGLQATITGSITTPEPGALWLLAAGLAAAGLRSRRSLTR